MSLISKLLNVAGIALSVPVGIFAAADVCVHNVDVSEYPIVSVAGEFYRGRDADAVLFGLYERENAVEEYMEMTRSGDIEAARTLAAVADRVATIKDKQRIIDFFMEKYGIGADTYPVSTEEALRAKSSVRIEISEEDIPLLCYLMDFLEFKYGVWIFAESNAQYPPLSYRNLRLTLKVWVEWATHPDKYEKQIRKTAEMLEELRRRSSVFSDPGATEYLLQVDIMLLHEAVSALVPYFQDTDPERAAARLAKISDDDIGKRFLVAYRGKDVAECVRLAEEGYHRYPAESLALLRMAVGGDFSSGSIDENWREDVSYTQYLSMRDRHPYGLRQPGVNDYGARIIHLAALLDAKKHADEFLTLYFFIEASDIKGFHTDPRWERARRAFPKIFFECRRNVSLQKLNELRERGRRMAEQGYYENEEFEKRFQDSLRERAKALKAKRAAASAGTETKNENGD